MTCPSERRRARLAVLGSLLVAAAAMPAAAQVAGTGGADDPFAGPSLFDRERPGGVGLGRLAVERRQAVPLVAHDEYLAAGSLAGRGALAFAGRTLAVGPQDPPERGIPPVARPGDRVALALEAAVRPGERLRGLRLGRRLPSGQRVVHASALLEVLAADGGAAEAVVRRVYGAYRAGDPVVPIEPFAPPGARLEPVREGRIVRVLGVEDAQPLLGLNDRVFLDAGTAAGVGPGDEFELLGPADRAGGARARLGTVRVVRAERNTATARVVELRAGALEGVDRARHVRRPEGPER